MSYSLETPCCNYPSPIPGGQGDCVKKDICTDRCVIQGAINAVHMMPVGVGHLGGGSIVINCSNKQLAQPETPAE
jgi:hypothetical protein